MFKPSQKILDMWEKEGWKYDNTEKGFAFTIVFPFLSFDRTITIFFEIEKNIKYYYIDTHIESKDHSDKAYEFLYVEPKEHMLIHKTLLDLKWIEEEEKEEEPKELTIFDFLEGQGE